MTLALRLVVDARPLVGNRTGIGVHTAEIVSRLELEPAALLAAHAPIADRRGLEQCRFQVDPMRPGVLWQQVRLPRVADEDRADLIWGPHGTLPLRSRVPAVVTMHDLTSLTMPLAHRATTLASFNLLISRSLGAARRIACVSQATADEVMRGFGVDASRLDIVPNGVDSFFSPGDGAAVELPFGLEASTYLLFVGTLEPRKGLDDLLSAWEGLRRERPLRLVLCGGVGWKTTRLLRRIEHHPRRAEIIVTGFVDRLQLRELYRRCAAFVYPSHYEGFGLPPLEAMACGAPVVTTNAGAIPEVVGDGALVVAPRDAAALRAALVRLLDSAALRSELAARGVSRAASFTWEKSAAAMRETLLRATR